MKALRRMCACRMEPKWLDSACPQHSKGASYQLLAVVTHLGKTLLGGHYVADVRHPGGGWIHCSDEKIRATSWEKVKAQRAYMLVYQLLD